MIDLRSAARWPALWEVLTIDKEGGGWDDCKVETFFLLSNFPAYLGGFGPAGLSQKYTTTPAFPIYQSAAAAVLKKPATPSGIPGYCIWDKGKSLLPVSLQRNVIRCCD